jgi:hypothetical protein
MHQGGMNGGGIPIDPLISQQSLGGSRALEHSADIYRSEAALALSSSIMPVLFSKAKDLASSIDAEIAEKDAELAEAERVAALRRQEIDALKRQAEELRQKEAEAASRGDGRDEELLAELQELIAECEGLTEDEQDLALKELLSEEERALENAPHDDIMMDDDDEEDNSVNHKMMLVRELQDLMQQRKNLFKTIVQNLSVAGLGDKQGEYKRLITGALGVKEEDVENMLPEIVAELEDWQLDNGNVV